MQTNIYFHRLTTNSYHNLCTKLNPPDGIVSLLELGLKFCMQSLRPTITAIDNTIGRSTRDVRLKCTFGSQEEDNIY